MLKETSWEGAGEPVRPSGEVFLVIFALTLFLHIIMIFALTTLVRMLTTMFIAKSNEHHL